jgi:hypothetical protein
VFLSSIRWVENTITGILKEELEKRNVKVGQFPSFTTPVGTRREPDLLVQNGVEYVIEAKLGNEASTLDAMGQVWDSIRYANMKGGFAVIYPDELRKAMPLDVLKRVAPDHRCKVIAIFEPKDPRPLTSHEGKLGEVAEWISQMVLRPPEIIEPDVTSSIKILRNAAQYLTLSLAGLTSEELADIFGGESVFSNILQYEKEEYPVSTMRYAAAYLLLNQIMFYTVLSSLNPKDFPTIDEDSLKRPRDLMLYFRKVLKIDYSATFGFDVASKVRDQAVREVRGVIKSLRALSPEKIRADLLGQIFHELIPIEIRKPVAAFYTSPAATHLLAHLAIESPHATVMDLAVGSGGLLVAAYARKKELLPKSLTDSEHSQFVGHDLTGVDIMPFAGHLAAINLSLQSPLSHTERVRVAIWDATELEPAQTIPAISRELKQAYKQPLLEKYLEGKKPSLPEDAFQKKGTLTMEGIGGEEIQLRTPDVILMNPPFTRRENLPENYVKKLFQRFQNYHEYLHGQLGLYGYFIFLVDKFLNHKGTAGLVLPATVLRLRSTAGLRRFLVENYSFRYVITTWQRAAFSEGAQFREILLVVEKSNSQAKPCVVATLGKLPKEVHESKAVAEVLSRFYSDDGKEECQDDWMSAFKISKEELAANVANLFSLVAFQNQRLLKIWRVVTRAGSGTLIHLEKYLEAAKARIIGGIGVTGSQKEEKMEHGQLQKLFILKDQERVLQRQDVWVVEKVSSRSVTARHTVLGNRISVPLHALAPTLRRLSRIGRLDVTDDLDHLVVGDFAELKDFLRISTGKTDVNFVKKRGASAMRRLGNLALARRLDLSASGTTGLAFYSDKAFVPGGVMWSLNLPNDEAKILTLWFNSALNLLQSLVMRKETRGAFVQLDQYALSDAAVPDPKSLSPKDRRELILLFDEISKATLPNLLEQLRSGHPIRVKLDEAMLRMVGIPETQIRSMRKQLHSELLAEINALKEMMEGK